MLLPHADTSKLSSENYARLEVFYRRFCEGALRSHYGLGHLVYACHAAFPLILSPELGNLIWVNFNNYPYHARGVGKIDAIAVSDFLLSPLCQQISHQQYEVIPQIRSYLLHLLKDGAWLHRYGVALKGAERLHQLAEFLQQYIKQKQPDANQEATGFSELNEWAALAYLNPLELAGQIGDALEKNNRNNQGQLWLNTQMERIEKQFNFDIHDHGGNKEMLRPFFNLFYYTQARKSEIFKKGEKLVNDNAGEIRSIPTGDGRGRVISMPLSKAIADRTNRRLNKVQRVVSLLIGIDEYAELKRSLRGCVYGAKQMGELLLQLNNSDNKNEQEGYATETVFTLFNEEATASNIHEAVQKLVAAANPEDICLIYFAGHGQNDSYQENTIIPVDYPFGNSSAITNIAFFSALQKARSQNPCKVLFILDSHAGYYNWVAPDDVFIGGVRHTTQYEKPFDGGIVASAFLVALNEIITVTKGKITYRHLLSWLRFKIEKELKIENQVPVLQTTLSNLDIYFLRTDSKYMGDEPVLAYNKGAGTWQVLEEDFKVLTLNTTAYPRNYENNERVEDISGEIFLRDNELCYGGATEGLDKNKLYKMIIRRPSLGIFFRGQIYKQPDYNKTVEELTGTFFDMYSKWENIHVYPEVPRVNRKPGPGYNNSVNIDIVDNNYVVEFLSDETEGTPELSWTFSQQTRLTDFIQRFARYHYLFHLKRPQEYYKLYQPLEVTMHCRWDRHTPDLLNQHQLILNEQALVLKGEIEINPLYVTIANREPFPVFCMLYLLVSDLTIKKNTSNELMPLLPNNTVTIELREPQIFKNMLSKGLSGQLKLLASRDPHQVDFSQEGINQQSNY